ncbi:MAG: guanylate kinase [Clostridia bacterium]|nr:guanylate kinase [Clostridia bacterium]MEE1024101.1 guanylate kinase [Acutalibacteraceae bacterium]
MSKKGTLFIFSGPSGSGKDTVLHELLLMNKNVRLSISTITRAPRTNEIPGEKYNFTTKEKFVEMINNNELLEYNMYLDNYYGTPKAPVDAWLNEGLDVILEIDVNGAFKVKEQCPDAVMVFLLPASIDILYHRLNKRGTEPQEVIDKRVNEAKREIALCDKYDYFVVNDVLEDAVSDFNAIIRAQALKKINMIEIINEVKKDA